MRRPLLWFLLLALGLALVVLIARHDDGGVGPVATEEFAVLAAKIGILVLIGGAVLSLFREGFSEALESALLWVVVALLLVLGYTYRFELREVGDRVMVELVPGHAAKIGRNVELARGRTGDFHIAAQVNGMPVPMVLDTGASSVVLTHAAAKAAGLPLEMVKYTVNVETANGHAMAAAVTLDRVAVGGLVERAVPALIAQPGQLKVSLLGMSFLNRLQSWEVRGSKLMMRGYP
jgi:aspartyl protease family protein